MVYWLSTLGISHFDYLSRLFHLDYFYNRVGRQFIWNGLIIESMEMFPHIQELVRQKQEEH